VLGHADDADAVEPPDLVDQDALALGQDCVVRGVSCDAEDFGDPGDGQMLAHDAFQCPPQLTARELGPRLGRASGVLAPQVPAPGAPVATHDDFQRSRRPAQRLVGQPPDHGVTGCPFASAPAAPLVRSVVRLDNPTRQHGAVRFEPLADDFEAELLKTAERGQVRSGQAKVPSGTSRSSR